MSPGDLSGRTSLRPAEQLNLGCFCITLDRPALSSFLDEQVGVEGFAARLAQSHPTLFSNVPVFVPADVVGRMQQIVQAVEAAARSPKYVGEVLRHAPPIAQPDYGPVGAFMGYDFHLTPQGPKLIEVNTNAGGAFLNAALARAHSACCAEVQDQVEVLSAGAFARAVAQMFVDEFRRQRGGGRPEVIAIVDDAPTEQHLFPEFQLAQALLEAEGFQVLIADASELTLNEGRLPVGDWIVDLVYNRLVDFALGEPRHSVLREAYVSGAAVVTPNPHLHALLADKRNLGLLSAEDRLGDWELPAELIAALRLGTLSTAVVSPLNTEQLWRDRRSYFFKPAGGHGSKAAFRGDKLTRRTWGDIVAGGYVAQAFAPPSLRGVETGGERTTLKTDVRLYTYAGPVLLAAARLYQGQTTNMRTAGGGFAPVLVVGETVGVCC